MSRPTTKTDLVSAANSQFEKLQKLVDSMSEERQNAPFSFVVNPPGSEAHWKRDKNLRDVLTHLYEWHQMVGRWYMEGLMGGMPAIPGEGYTWRTLPELNQRTWERYQDVSLEDAKKMLNESHSMILGLIEKHTNEELFSKGVYKWTKSSTMGAYFVGCTSSHYDWAMKKLKIHAKAESER